MDDQFPSLLPVVRACCLAAVRDVLGLEGISPLDDWRLVDRVENHCAFGATVGFASTEFQGACTLGIEAEDAQEILPNLDEDLIFDALGETCNNICGLIASNSRFIATFGGLEQTPPLFSRGGAWLPRARGIAGGIASGSAALSVGCSIRPLTFRR